MYLSTLILLASSALYALAAPTKGLASFASPGNGTLVENNILVRRAYIGDRPSSPVPRHPWPLDRAAPLPRTISEFFYMTDAPAAEWLGRTNPTEILRKRYITDVLGSGMYLASNKDDAKALALKQRGMKNPTHTVTFRYQHGGEMDPYVYNPTDRSLWKKYVNRKPLAPVPVHLQKFHKYVVVGVIPADENELGDDNGILVYFFRKNTDRFHFIINGIWNNELQVSERYPIRTGHQTADRVAPPHVTTHYYYMTNEIGVRTMTAMDPAQIHRRKYYGDILGPGMYLASNEHDATTLAARRGVMEPTHIIIFRYQATNLDPYIYNSEDEILWKEYLSFKERHPLEVIKEDSLLKRFDKRVIAGPLGGGTIVYFFHKDTDDLSLIIDGSQPVPLL